MNALPFCGAIAAAGLLSIAAVAGPPPKERVPLTGYDMAALEWPAGDYQMEDDLQGAGLRAGDVISVRRKDGGYSVQGARFTEPVQMQFTLAPDGRTTHVVLTEGHKAAHAHRLR